MSCDEKAGAKRKRAWQCISTQGVALHFIVVVFVKEKGFCLFSFRRSWTCIIAPFKVDRRGGVDLTSVTVTDTTAATSVAAPPLAVLAASNHKNNNNNIADSRMRAN